MNQFILGQALGAMMMVSFFLMAPGCISHVSATRNLVKKYHTTYGVAKLPPSWERKSFRGADLFFQHKNSDAMIFLNSQCEKVSDSPLQALLSQMLVGMGKYDIVSEQLLNLADREALIADVNVRLDGVFRYLKIMVLRKNRCVFDAVLSASNFDQNLVNDYDEMIKSFCAEADL